MGNKEFQFLRLVMLVTDFILINCSAVTGMLLREQDFFQITVPVFFILVNVSWLGIAVLLKLYSYTSINSLEITYRQSWRSLFLQTVFLYFCIYVFSSFNITRRLVLNYASFAGALLLISRFFQTYLVEFFFKKIKLNKVSRKITIIGYDDIARQLAAYFERNNNIYQFLGFFTDSRIKNAAPGIPLYPLDACINYAIENNVKEIYSTELPDQTPKMQELVTKAEANFLRIWYVGDKFINLSNDAQWVQIDRLNHMPVLALRHEPLERTFNRVKKRAFDFIFSSFVIIFIMSWLTPLLGLMIKLNSKGPVFFIQDRSGKDNKTFRCMKFRSMCVNSDSDEKQAGKNDTRITRVGRFMRKTNLDEFPQFFNVFIGNMSISGPRPHMLKHTEEYSKIINKYMVRHFLKPGLTGWAQVNGYRGETEDHSLMEKRVEYDIWYMENWSLMLDIRIIFLTIFNMFKGEENAY
jgi:putative colanic acid biosynthesis UDP-glucose lipid carrier transferase